MLPNFIGIGAPKAGTTWLARCLAEHPEVFVAVAKEVSFLDYGSIQGRLAEYERHFVGAEGVRAVGEFTTRYLASDRPPPRIRQLLPNAQLIVSLRNPVDQVYSHYWHLMRQNFHGFGPSNLPHSFEDALAKHADRLLIPAFYYRHLHRWLQHFDRNQFLILFYDDICDRPGDVLSIAYSFLGVDSSFVAPSLRVRDSNVRQGVSPRSKPLNALYSRLYDGLNRHVYRPLKRVLGVAGANRLKDALRFRQTMERLFFKTGYPRMSQQTRSLLIERFADDVHALEELTGRDLSHWRSDPVR